MNFVSWKIAFLFLFSMPSFAAEALALGYQPKYTAGFSHFLYANPNAPKRGQIRLGTVGGFDSLNPYSIKGDPIDGGNLLVESLMERSLDEPFSMYGLLAQEMFLAADGLSVRFKLNPKAIFSDGSPVTAQAVKLSFEKLLSKEANPMFRLYYADVERAEVLSEREIRFTFKKKNSELHLILGELPVFAVSFSQKPFSETSVPIGSGPYRLQQFSLGKTLSFERRKNYWGEKLPVRQGAYNFDRVVYQYFRDETIRLEAFKAGEFDLTHENYAKQWAKSYQGEKFRDSRILKTHLPHRRSEGMQGFVMNQRRAIFHDAKVRKALALAFDFEWSNKNLFFGQYERSQSYFSNSEMEASGKAVGLEFDYLKPYLSQLPERIVQAPYRFPKKTTPFALRAALREAKALLESAGWFYQNGALRNTKGQPFDVELLINTRSFERIAGPYAQLLKKLGVNLQIRVVDPALYARRLENFDFDMIVQSISQSASPGNELFDFFSSEAADLPGSRNLMGLKNPVVDALIKNLVQAPDREHLVAASRALDRVLIDGHYVIPNWHIPYHRIAWWNRFAQPAVLPDYYSSLDWAVKYWWENSKQ